MFIAPKEKEELQLIVNTLLDDEAGKFKYMKESIKRHALDYRKVFNLGEI
jgi:hypothetical protein